MEYLSCMDNRYLTLQTLYRIVREETHPEQYLCTPRELVLHSTFGWELIHKHLQNLAEEGLVVLQQLDTPHCYITPLGMEKMQAVYAESASPDSLELLLRQEMGTEG